MRESTNSSRSWRAINFLARIRNKVKRKADAFFVNHFFDDAEHPAAAPPPTHAAAPTQPWIAPNGQFDYNETSGSNHTSTPNRQYFNPADDSEYDKQHQLPRFEFSQLHVRARSFQPQCGVPEFSMDFASSHGFHQDRMYNSGQQFQAGDGMLRDHHLPTTHNQGFLQDFDHQYYQVPMSVTEYSFSIPVDSYGEISELSDAVTEMQRDEPMSSWQANMNYSQEHGAPSMSTQMSGDTVETVNSNMMDTGNSSYVLPPHPEKQRRTDINQYIERVQRILFEEELRLSRKRGFRVVASIVYFFRRLREIVRRKRMQRSTPYTPMSGELEGSGSCKMKRIRSAECSDIYRGIKKRKGKWVAEIRVSKLQDKVWLGTFQLEKEAALAHDAGLHHCSLKRNKIFNFKESPQKLGPSQYSSLHAMMKKARKTKVQSLASDHAIAYGSSNNIH